eukprot:scaffold787_cov285-Chaetoceros_neogracile.AAC.17
MKTSLVQLLLFTGMVNALQQHHSSIFRRFQHVPLKQMSDNFEEGNVSGYDTRRNVLNGLLGVSTWTIFGLQARATDVSDPFRIILTVQTDVKSEVTSEIEIEVRPDWAPLAAKRFKELVEIGYYNESRFHRVLPGYVAQFGIAADPGLNKEWMFCETNCKALPDEARKQRNKRGTLSFASSGKNSRQTQIFINLGNNDGPPNFLDGQNFVPFARVVNGMDDAVKNLNSEYGILESVTGGLTGSVNQGKAAYYGSEYLDVVFPKLSVIKSAKVLNEV